jgi:hypothetical protein
MRGEGGGMDKDSKKRRKKGEKGDGATKAPRAL